MAARRGNGRDVHLDHPGWRFRTTWVTTSGIYKYMYIIVFFLLYVYVHIYIYTLAYVDISIYLSISLIEQTTLYLHIQMSYTRHIHRHPRQAMSGVSSWTYGRPILLQRFGGEDLSWGI